MEVPKIVPKIVPKMDLDVALDLAHADMLCEKDKIVSDLEQVKVESQHDQRVIKRAIEFIKTEVK